jgi:hypothetical protein
MGLFLLLTAYCLLISCKSVKKSTDTLQFSEQITASDTLSRTVSESTDIAVNLQVDTSIKKVTVGGVKIFPKGEFTIDAQGTFQGQADSVVTDFHIQQEETIQIQDQTQIKLDSTDQESQSSQADANTLLKSENSSTERTPNLLPYIGLALVLIGVIAFVMWRLKIL